MERRRGCGRRGRSRRLRSWGLRRPCPRGAILAV